MQSFFRFFQGKRQSGSLLLSIWSGKQYRRERLSTGLAVTASIALVSTVAWNRDALAALADSEESEEMQQIPSSMPDMDKLKILPNFSALPTFKSKLDSSICGAFQYAANNPVEDRFTIEKLSNGGWWFSVFDGHGGWQCSDFAQKKLHKNFEIELNNHLGSFEDEEGEGPLLGNIGSRVISNALVSAFERTDRQYMSKVSGAFEIGFGRDTRAGSCALSAFVLDGVLFCANAGDSRAIIASSKTDEKRKQKTSKVPEVIRNLVPRPKAEPEPVNLKSVEIQDKLQEIALSKSTGYPVSYEEELLLRKQLQEILIENGAESKTEQDNPDDKVGYLQWMYDLVLGSESFFPYTSHTVSADSLDFSLLENIDLSNYVKPFALTNDHNAKLSTEQEKLRNAHPNERDIVVCKHKNACYVKGRLQPTRALGDFHLKYSEFQLPRRKSTKGSLSSPYTPPYITCTPEVKVKKLSRDPSEKDEILVIGSDGLWDVLPNETVAELAIKFIRLEGKSPSEAAEALVEEALDRCAKKNKLTLEDLKQLKQGRDRRSKHDDITVVVVDLSQLMEQYFFG